MPLQAEEIEILVEKLNDAWLNGHFEDMDGFFHKLVVLIEPGTTNKITGRERMIESYREFMDTAEVSEFKVRDLAIDVFETTAVALYRYRIKYRVESTRYDETGTEILVFHRHNDHWSIVWRSQSPAIQS